jgi:protein-S-isoprenylcysteine O-methyltransferase Ste14
MKFVNSDDEVSSLKSDEKMSAHQGAGAVAAVFHTVAIVVLALGLVGAIAVGVNVNQHLGESVGSSVAYAIAVALSGVFLACVLAFFGYVLDLLTEIAENTGNQTSADNPPTAASAPSVPVRADRGSRAPAPG